MTKSSAPSRATVSTWRMVAVSRSAISVSSRSPMAGPSLSLMGLKRSRFSHISANEVDSRCDSASAYSMRSISSLRLGSPVRVSMCDMASMRRLASMLSLTSRNA